METEIKSAFVKAGAKLSIGLTLVVAVVGIRMITVTPEGLPTAIEKLERLESELAAEAPGTRSAHPFGEDGNSEDSIVSRLTAGLRDGEGNDDSGSREGERLVSCRVAASTHFMRADDCAMRGGVSTVIDRER